jgi:hypothetical protein
MSRTHRFLALASALATVSSCGLKQNLDEVHDKTLEVAKTTGEVKHVTCTTYRSLRQGAPKESRDQDLQDIRNAKTIAGKLAEAAEYMQGFEYQVWSPECEGDLSRDEILEMSVRELLAKMQGYVDDRSDVSASKIAPSNEMDTLYALAGTLHYVNPLQKNLLRGTSYEVLRPFDIIVRGLELDQRKNRGEAAGEYPIWAETVGKYQKDAIYLLRLRQNFMMAYAYALADSDEYGNKPGKYEEGKRLVGTGWLNKVWTPNLKSRTPTEIDQRITFALNLVVETNEALVKLGLDPMMDGTLAKFWENADFSSYDPAQLRKDPTPGSAQLAESVQRLMKARDRVVTAFKKSRQAAR